MTRQIIKQDLRRIAEIGIIAVLGKVPRKLRRSTGRMFANAAYRSMKGLDYDGNREVVEWITREYEGYQKYLHTGGHKEGSEDQGLDSTEKGE